jgi:quercetin dioxygenase-like cupin family protein
MFVRRAETPVEQPEPGITRQILGHDPHLMLVRVTFAAGAVGYVHQHPHRQVSYVERGTFEVRLGESTTVLKAGDCFFVPPDVPHGVVAKEEGALLDTFTPAREDFLPSPRP